MDSSPLWAIGAMLAWGLGDFLLQRSSRATSPYSVAWRFCESGKTSLAPMDRHCFVHRRCGGFGTNALAPSTASTISN